MSGLEELVCEMARGAGLRGSEQPTVIVERDRGCAHVRYSRRKGLILYADPRLARAPVEVQRQIVGHELAHVLVGHVYRPLSARRLLLILALLAAGLLLMAGGVTGHFGLFYYAGVAVCLAGAVVAVAGIRAQELDADWVARERLGVAFDERLAEWLKRSGFRYRVPVRLECFGGQREGPRRMLGARRRENSS